MGLLTTTREWNEALEGWRGIQDAPAPENRGRPRGFKVLENDFLEKYFVTSHWAMPGVWFLPVIALCVIASRGAQGHSWSVIAGCMLAGTLGWTFVEYVLHRFVFHLPATKIRPIRFVLFTMHGYHHEFPNDPGRLVAPPVLSWPISALLALLFWALFGPWWQAIFAGTLLGYLAYDWMHYYNHHGTPKSRFGRFMRRFHMEHHYKNATTQFGLSSPLWDLVLGTYRRPTPPTPVEQECLGPSAIGGVVDADRAAIAGGKA
jgi:sterol desaturase/sphingolipid hydroxylase (fatty acid hydroxylase superfamily)